jgi:hypothetical protein
MYQQRKLHLEVIVFHMNSVDYLRYEEYYPTESIEIQMNDRV